MHKRLTLAALSLLCVTAASAQRYPERQIVRAGNADVRKGDFATGEVEYRRALEKNPASFEALANLGGALYKQGRFAESDSLYRQAVQGSASPLVASQTFYNTGNAQFKQRKLEEAIESYKNALRINPDDMEAKFNLAYAKKLLDKDRNGGGGGGDNDRNQDQNNDQNQNNDSDQNQNDRNQNRDQNNPDRNQDQDQQQQAQGGMSREEAERMLEAVQSNDDNTRRKVDGQKAAKAGARSGKNW